MTPYAQMLQSHIRPESQGAFYYEYQRYAKDPSVATALTIFLGIVGGEAYYFGDYKRGILMTLALFSGVGTLITIPLWIVRCFTITGECEAYNDYLAYALAYRYFAAEGLATPQPPQSSVAAPNAPRPTITGLPVTI